MNNSRLGFVSSGPRNGLELLYREGQAGLISY